MNNPVREHAMELAQASFQVADQRIGDQSWWPGAFSIIDVYLNWAFMVARHGGFDRQRCPHLVDLAERLKQQPTIARVIAWDFKKRAELGL